MLHGTSLRVATKFSPGCKNCYAERYAKRLQSMSVKKYSNEFELTFHQDVMTYPSRLKDPRMIFVNSMSDLFHERIHFELIDNIFLMMQKADWHTYQILTKRSKRLADFGKYYGKFPDNVWIGVSVESSAYKNRIQNIKSTSKNSLLKFRTSVRTIRSFKFEGYRMDYSRRRIRP